MNQLVFLESFSGMGRMFRQRGLLCTLLTALWLAGCGGFGSSGGPGSGAGGAVSSRALEPTPEGREVVMYALGLIGTDYRFGGKNPEAGLDCSGMVSYIYKQATPVKVDGSAADIARKGRPVGRQNLRPGDLVFFNTHNFSCITPKHNSRICSPTIYSNNIFFQLIYLLF